MNYYVIVLPMSKDGSVNRQILAFNDYESAKQSFHFQCGKYFKSETLKMASVCILDDYSNKIISDCWVTIEEQKTEV